MDLIYLNGKNQGSRCQLTPPGISIGSEADNDLQLTDDGVSQYHAMISFDGNDWYIEDLGSSTGTFIGSCQVLQKQKLSPGDLIGVGNQKFKFGTAPKPVQIIPESPEEPQADLASEIRKSKYSIFGGSQKNSNKNPESGKKKSKLGNLIFTLVVITLPLVIISGYMMLEKQKEIDAKKVKPKPVNHPFFLYYEKIITKPDNVFRFEVKISGEKVIFTVDDLKYGRHFIKEEVLDGDKIEKLKADIKKTEFQKLQNDNTNTPIGPVETYRRIDLALDGAFNSVVVNTVYGKTSFERVERAVSDLAQFYSVQTGLLTAEEMRDLAKQSFVQAEELYKNYQASPKNIRLSINKYKAALSYYEQFEPKPREWNICRKQLEKAQELYKKLYADLVFNIQKYNKMNRPDLASQECGKMLELLDPGSDNHQKFREYKIIFDKNSNILKKKKRKK